MITHTFGQRLHAERKRRGLTLKELGALTGVHFSAVGQYERGEHEPTVFSAACIAEALGLSLDYLSGRSNGEFVERDGYNILCKAIDAFGERTQIKKFFEEAAELQEAVCKLMDGRDEVEHVAEEIADLSIMLDQLRIIFGCGKRVDEITAEKLARLERRIEKQVGKNGRK